MKNSNVGYTLRKAAAFLPAALIMVTIFYFSAQPKPVSSVQSMTVTQQLVTAFAAATDKGWSPEQIFAYSENIESFVRKAAHMTEYFCLALSLSLPLRKKCGLSVKKSIALAFCIAAGYAASDEFHQRFVEGRAGRFTDVLIDSCGAFPGAAAGHLRSLLSTFSVRDTVCPDSGHKKSE